jgi:hypothetical protein
MSNKYFGCKIIEIKTFVIADIPTAFAVAIEERKLNNNPERMTSMGRRRNPT